MQLIWGNGGKQGLLWSSSPGYRDPYGLRSVHKIKICASHKEKPTYSCNLCLVGVE